MNGKHLSFHMSAIKQPILTVPSSPNITVRRTHRRSLLSLNKPLGPGLCPAPSVTCSRIISDKLSYISPGCLPVTLLPRTGVLFIVSGEIDSSPWEDDDTLSVLKEDQL